jgi:2-keto-3-deoxy-L-rhamnonate aldolase RhmA
LIGNILDLGPVGIEVPQVETLETVKEAVHYFYYPQMGGRSVGGTARYKVGERPGRTEYGSWWNQTGFLSIQMESLRAVTTVSQLAIDGVDCLTWGPNDLLYDIEAHPKHPIQTVDDCVKHALDQLRDSQTRISFRSYDHKLRNKYIDMGVTVLMEHPK